MIQIKNSTFLMKIFQKESNPKTILQWQLLKTSHNLTC